ncbi:uncharacterized protein CC84DRAFT_1216632 [Paraphaeosphaeria sporulosa]|uniref:DUF6594 domain-containing protein n=1 Tax=Paraphaeosphaeria sporulosa TaxID=1460663 RepID=A0A177CLH4_9PLEO|nr:uncharacterized protein CC84DRAFT_1216632 [Paraphaeosphaeria sporulosa]OAG07718.1 hypothetical protein CC84DRAFT_1216632 [Paraphaeosphaeria sporulosa]
MANLDWALREDEVITLYPKRRIRLTIYIDKVVSSLPFPSWMITSRLDKRKFPDVKYFSEKRLLRMSSSIATVIALVFILVPIGQLYFNVDNWTNWEKFGRIIGWSCGFWIYLWLCTLANGHETLGASASYGSLLVVFLGLTRR